MRAAPGRPLLLNATGVLLVGLHVIYDGRSSSSLIDCTSMSPGGVVG